jgi:hypothetical protein
MAERAARRIDGAAVGIGVAAVATDLLCRFFPAHLPYFFPFIFNAPVFLGTWFTLLWYFRGLARVAEAKRPGGVRRAFFLAGVLSIYFVLQTRFEYLSQHLFSLNRVQAVTLSMAAPFCIGIAWMQDVLPRRCDAPRRQGSVSPDPGNDAVSADFGYLADPAGAFCRNDQSGTLCLHESILSGRRNDFLADGARSASETFQPAILHYPGGTWVSGDVSADCHQLLYRADDAGPVFILYAMRPDISGNESGL